MSIVEENFQRAIFNDVSIVDEPASKILELIKNRRAKAVSYIVTPNADHFCRLEFKTFPAFNEAYENADIRVCDSRIIQKLSMLGPNPIRYVTPGSDLTRMVLESTWAKDSRMFVVGPDDADVKLIREKYALHSLKCYTPPMGFISSEFEVDKCVEAVMHAGADIVFLAVGSPQQEILAARVKSKMNAECPCSMTMLCVGASFDFLSGKCRRAPYVMQVMHLEWLHRIASNPVRLIPRYWKNGLWVLNFVCRRIFRPG